MRFRSLSHIEDEKIQLQMTPMIDIVFQLLIFFIMSFKIVAQEGDFNVKMPLAAATAGTPDESLLPPLKLRLQADRNGALEAIRLNERSFNDFRSLHEYIRELVGDQAGPGSVSEPEIEIDTDYHLRYRYAIDAITAVSGYLDANGNVVKLIEKIKFAPPHPEDSDTPRP